MDTLAHKVLSRFLAVPDFTGVFLDETSKNRLLDWWSKQTGTELLERVRAEHMTIKFKPTQEEYEQTPLGQKIMLRIVGWAADERGQAVLVQPRGLSAAVAYPHVTIATAPGVKSSYSNELLARGFTRAGGPTLTGIVRGEMV